MRENKYTRKIPLTQGKSTTVDDEDFDRLNAYKWYANKEGNTYYAVRHSKRQNRKMIRMHREILGFKAGDGKQIDHINSNGLDNRRANLRICTRSQNKQNQHSVCGTSRYKGVCWHKQTKKWQADICLERRQIHLGLFDNEIEAAKAYDAKAKELFGEFAKYNFIKIDLTYPL